MTTDKTETLLEDRAEHNRIVQERVVVQMLEKIEAEQHPFIANLERLKNNLALVKALFERHPHLFDHVSHVQLDHLKPRVMSWSWNGSPEEKQAIAKSHRDGNWKRHASWDRIDYTGEVDGVEFVLEGAEKPAEATVTSLFPEA